MALTTEAAMKVSAEMMSELALGMEDGVTIAQRYGFSAVEFATLATQPWFTKALRAQQDSIEDKGWTYRAKMAMFAEDLAFEVWAAAKQSDSASIKLDAAKYFSKMADLEPKPNTTVATGSGYSITINLPAPPEPQNALEASGDHPPPKIIDIQLNSEPPAIEGPAPFRVPDFDLTSHEDLSALPAEFSADAGTQDGP